MFHDPSPEVRCCSMANFEDRLVRELTNCCCFEEKEVHPSLRQLRVEQLVDAYVPTLAAIVDIAATAGPREPDLVDHQIYKDDIVEINVLSDTYISSKDKGGAFVNNWKTSNRSYVRLSLFFQAGSLFLDAQLVIKSFLMRLFFST